MNQGLYFSDIRSNGCRYGHTFGNEVVFCVCFTAKSGNGGSTTAVSILFCKLFVYVD